MVVDLAKMLTLFYSNFHSKLYAIFIWENGLQSMATEECLTSGYVFSGTVDP